MKIFSAEQIRQWDASTIQREPISSEDLMERAATACFDWILSRYKLSTSFVVFCGTGNNGGDGLALARKLGIGGFNVKVYMLDSDHKSPDFNSNYARYPSSLTPPQIINPAHLPGLAPSEIIIDALFGTGLSRPLAEEAAALVAHINSSAASVISIDIPSGLFADRSSGENPVIHAAHTLTFQSYKLGLLVTENAAAIGDVYLLNIGLDQSYYSETLSSFATIDAALINSIYKPRKKFTHKYNFGHAYLFAGSRFMMGAGILCAKACLRTGAGLVTVQTDAGTEGVVQAAFPEAITSAESDWRKAAQKKTVIGIGPGMQQTADNAELMKELLAEFDGALVVDATGLQLLSQHTDLLSDRRHPSTILTPHSGEFEKLFGKTVNDFERLERCLSKAKELKVHIILKGHHSFIACPDGQGFFNTSGNAGMATAGSGDVLTGILCGLLAQGYSATDACVLGVYVHGVAGDAAAARNSQESLIASDIIDALGTAFLKIANPPSSPTSH
ncbi:MAG: NAD(P)H-hydrate dehydratase [Ferruginibacter sp.]|nr:NAD(P)H-hydrate dehydratase [Ferruginibacter sp.]